MFRKSCADTGATKHHVAQIKAVQQQKAERVNETDPMGIPPIATNAMFKH
jgi:hypothetical protein